MHAFLELLAEIAAYALPEWIQRSISPKNQIWATLGCTIVMLAVVALGVMLFAAR